MINAIVTHSGSFHADEIAALYLLEKVYLKHPISFMDDRTTNLDLRLAETDLPKEDAPYQIPVIRTRDSNLLSISRMNPSVLVMDVGGEFDDKMLNFDHHQQSMTETWEDGTPYSSAGLVWRWLKNKGLLEPEFGEEMIAVLEKELIRPLDSHDNGMDIFEPAMTLDLYNRDRNQLIQFEKAFHFFKEYMDNRIYHLNNDLQCEIMLKKAWAERQPGSRHIILEESPPGNRSSEILKAISGDQALLMGISKGKNKNAYSLVSMSKDTAFSIKCPFPEEWCGRMNFEVTIDEQSIPMVFVHKNGFMGIIEGNRENCEKVAQHVISKNFPLSPTPKSVLKNNV